MSVINTVGSFLTGAGQLILQIPDGSYFNCKNYAIRIAQALPTDAGAKNPVAIQIGDGSTFYSVIRRCGHYLYADQIMANRNYILKVAADSNQLVLECGYMLTYNPGQVAALPNE